MKAASICRQKCVTISVSDDLAAAAKLMRDEHIGFLVVVEPGTSKERGSAPVGVITDRDIVVAVVARDADPGALRVGDVMTPDPVVVRSDASLENVARMMRDSGIRRAPVVDVNGRACGVVSIDDILDVLARQLTDLAALIRNERRIEQVTRI